jgi:uncharacterized protein (TIGR02145 family)
MKNFLKFLLCLISLLFANCEPELLELSEQPIKPEITTTTFSSITATSATLNATINPRGISTKVIFEYGLTLSYGSEIVANQSPVSGTSNITVSASIKELTEGATYHFRVKAESVAGTNYGNDEQFQTSRLPSVTTTEAIFVTAGSYTLNGTVNANGQSTTVTFEYGLTTSYGSVVNASQSPVSGTGNTAVSANITGLTEGKTYHFRVKVNSLAGPKDGNDVSFITLQGPSATTIKEKFVTTTSYTLNGTVNANGQSTTVTFEYGLTTSYGSVVDAAQSPVSGTGNTAVSANITGLTEGKVYHFRVKAVSRAGSKEGNDLSFTTFQLPSVTTTEVIQVTPTSAIIGGNVIDDGGSPVVQRGVCWSTVPNPTTSNLNKPATENGIGSFSITITGLSPGKEYHVRAFAINSLGKPGYGEDRTFTTDVIDGDDNTYKTVKIGNQLWMAENLRTTKFNDGTNIPIVLDNTTWSNLTTSSYSWYLKDETTYKYTYGALYNWYAVNTNKLCPLGWSVPTDDEWTILENALGGRAVAGGELKEEGSEHWNDPNDANNNSGFTALPGGSRQADGTFNWMVTHGFWWSSTQINSTNAWNRNMYFLDKKVSRDGPDKKSGYSIRCLKD